MSFRQYSVVAGRQRLQIYDSGGKGSAIVMLHGNSASSAVFARQFASPLARSHRLIAIDLPGHGGSDNAHDPEHDYTVAGLAGTLDKALVSLGLYRPVLLGWSLGGHVALQIAASNNSIAGLFLIGTPPLARGPLGLLRAFQTRWDLFLTTKPAFTDQDVLRFAKIVYREAQEPEFVEAVRRADGRLRVQFFRSLMNGAIIDQKRFVETSPMPIAILNGEHEPFARLSYLRDISFAHLWRDRCHVVPGTGHTPFWQASDLVNPLIGAFADEAAAMEGTAAGRRIA